MNKTLLFTRKFNKEVYKFYLNEGEGCMGIYDEYISVQTPENAFGYSDTVLFNYGEAYTLHRYLQPWIKREIKKAIIKKGYEDYIK